MQLWEHTPAFMQESLRGSGWCAQEMLGSLSNMLSASSMSFLTMVRALSLCTASLREKIEHHMLCCHLSKQCCARMYNNALFTLLATYCIIPGQVTGDGDERSGNTPWPALHAAA